MKAVKIILVITKNEAKKLADKGLQFHKDLFTLKTVTTFLPVTVLIPRFPILL